MTVPRTTLQCLQRQAQRHRSRSCSRLNAGASPPPGPAPSSSPSSTAVAPKGSPALGSYDGYENGTNGASLVSLGKQDFAKFVQLFRQASPYIAGHRGKTFVLVVPGHVGLCGNGDSLCVGGALGSHPEVFRIACALQVSSNKALLQSIMSDIAMLHGGRTCIQGRSSSAPQPQLSHTASELAYTQPGMAATSCSRQGLHPGSRRQLYCAAPTFAEAWPFPVLLAGLGIRLVVVVGVQNQINDMMRSRGLTPAVVGGYRITDKETLQIAIEAAGQVRTRCEQILSKVSGCAPAALQASRQAASSQGHLSSSPARSGRGRSRDVLF